MDNDLQELRDEFEQYKMDSEKRMKALEIRADGNELSFKNHEHDGKDTKKIQKKNVFAAIRAAGSITMATDGRAYKLGIIDNPTKITFTGAAIHSTDGSFAAGTIDIRSSIVGHAILGHSFQFQPVDDTEVTAGGPAQNFIQNSNAITVKVSATAAMLTTVSENHLVSVNYPDNSTIVARATVTEFGQDYVEVTVTLAADWMIVGNFTVE